MYESLEEGGAARIVVPHGLTEIVATFGDVLTFILPDHTLDPRWQAEFLTTVALPFYMPLSWDRSRLVDHFACHKRLASIFCAIFNEIQTAGLQPAITGFGGCFSFRPQRTGTKLSTHAWGIAVDLNPESNEQGTTGNMDPNLVAFFKQAGFCWGGNWEGRTRDPMHFQYCAGY